MHTPSNQNPARSVLRTPYERAAAAYWHHKHLALQSFLRRDDGDRYHNHHGLGAYDPRLFEGSDEEREVRLLAELHRLESDQSERLISLLGAVAAEERILDAGSGRGGTSFAAYARFGCWIDGVDIARYQVDFANQVAAAQGCAERVKFHFRNLAATGFPAEHFSRVLVNEVTMYVDLDEAFAELARVLKPGGTLVLLTFCRNDVVAPTCRQAAVIDANYVCCTHKRSEYLQTLAKHGLSVRTVLDLTSEATSYFELRQQTRTFGREESIDEACLSGYRRNLLQYIAVVADRIPR